MVILSSGRRGRTFARMSYIRLVMCERYWGLFPLIGQNWLVSGVFYCAQWKRPLFAFFAIFLENVSYYIIMKAADFYGLFCWQRAQKQNTAWKKDESCVVHAIFDGTNAIHAKKMSWFFIVRWRKRRSRQKNEVIFHRSTAQTAFTPKKWGDFSSFGGANGVHAKKMRWFFIVRWRKRRLRQKNVVCAKSIDIRIFRYTMELIEYLW